MPSFEIGVLAVILYICVYGIINRICNCIEQVTANKYGAKEDQYEQSRNETNASGAEESKNSYL